MIKCVSNAPPCPLCNSPLDNGNTIKSKVFNMADKSKEDHLCYIYGCTLCYPANSLKRFCPVCKKALAADQFLFGRIFTKTTSGKPHVIINGCPNCRTKSP